MSAPDVRTATDDGANTVSDAAPNPQAGHGPVFWIGLLIGAAMIGYGVQGVWASQASTRPTDLGKWASGLLIFHDLILAPAVFAVVALGNRFRVLASPYVRGALAMSVLLAFVTWPLIRGYGQLRDNPTLLPLNYGANLIGALVVIWTFAVVATVISMRRERLGRRP